MCGVAGSYASSRHPKTDLFWSGGNPFHYNFRTLNWLKWRIFNSNHRQLSSPRAESARAVTGRRCPHSGRGEDFLTGQPDFFTETAVTPEQQVEKSFPRSEINRHAEG